MRVIAGEARGVPLVAPKGSGTRPTADRLKGAMFAVLGERGGRGRVADLFAGSGALGIEALSRGAEHCDFVESSRAACRTIETNLARTRLAGRARVICRPVARFLAADPAAVGPYDLMLMDPPYALAGFADLLETVASSPLVGTDSALVVEHASRVEPPARLGPLALAKTRRHGDGAFSLYLAELT